MLARMTVISLQAGETRILLSGMIGSRQGWRESQALQCPAGVENLARALTPVPFDGATIVIVPGLTCRDANGVAEFMRGEETQIVGLLPAIGGEGLVSKFEGRGKLWLQSRNLAGLAAWANSQFI